MVKLFFTLGSSPQGADQPSAVINKRDGGGLLHAMMVNIIIMWRTVNFPGRTVSQM